MSKSTIKIVIIGAGMAGLLSAIRLKRAGYTQISVFEKADRLGGTWRDNSYPGLTCDTPSHSYTYSFAPNSDWSSFLPSGPEVLAYFEKNAKQYGVHENIHFGEEITSCIFREGCWHLQSSRQRSLKADFVIAATGVLHHPAIPAIEGMNNFDGALFHSARWDHSSAVEGKRIAVIGNGSTGVQLVSALVHQAAQVTHFQRTPQWIMPVVNEPYSEAQIQAFRNDPELLHLAQNDPELNAKIDAFSEAIVDPDGPVMALIEAAVRENLESSVSDPVLREQLRPTYKAACKRLIYSPDYYQAIQSPAARLVRDRIEHIESGGIRTADGELHGFDLIVLATGFKAHQFMRPMILEGLEGMTLEKLWQKRPNAYLSVAMPAFPNFFMLNGPNGPVGNFSLTEIAEAQQIYIEQILERVVTDGLSQVRVQQAAYDDFNRRRIEAAKTTVFGTGCSSWYLDSEGVPATWPWTRSHFMDVMKTPQWSDYELLS